MRHAPHSVVDAWIGVIINALLVTLLENALVTPTSSAAYLVTQHVKMIKSNQYILF